MGKQTDELDNIEKRYEKRKNVQTSNLYNKFDSSVYMSSQEKERAIIKLLKYAKLTEVSDKKVLEVGCGSGGNLLTLMQYGFKPENLVGNELLEERALSAKALLPNSTKILQGDALSFDFDQQLFDIVLQSTVFTSILDDDFKQKLAQHMWSLVKPGGGVMWYDFTYNNPENPDVKGITLKEVKKLFPQAKIKCWRITLAPPINRLVTKVHPSMYTIFNTMPFLRTHILCWLEK